MKEKYDAIKRAAQELEVGLEETKAKEMDLSKEITEMKRAVNQFAIDSRPVSGRRLASVKIAELRKQAEYVLQNMMIKEQELASITANHNVHRASLGNIRSYISHQETFRNLNRTLEAVKNAGLDLDLTERMIEKSARTADEMRQVSIGITDRLAASAQIDSSIGSERMTEMLDALFSVDRDSLYSSSSASSLLSHKLPFPEVVDGFYNSDDSDVKVDVL